MTFSEDGTVKTEKMYAGTVHIDLNKMTQEEFEKKHKMTKQEFKRLDKKYAAKPGDDDLNTGCLSSEEIKIVQSYTKMFGKDLLLSLSEDYSWEQREYLFREGKKAIAGERGIIHLEEVIKP